MAARRTESKSKIKIESKKNRENSSQKNDSSALKNEDSDSVKSEILLTVAALLSVLFILSYFNICGKFGEMLSGIMFGLMGIFTYVFPIVFFFLSAFCISNKGNRIAQQKIISAIIFIFLLTALIQIIYGIDENRSFFDYYTYCAETKTGGGIFGAVLCVPLMYFFGQLATVIIISALMIICIMILTGKALFTYLRKKSEISIKKGKERYHQREEIFESIEEEEIKETLEYRKKFPFVTIEPENGEKEKKASSNQNENKRPPEAPISFLDALKDKGRKSENKHIFSTDEIELMNMAEPLETSTVEMSEIHPEKSKYTIVGNITEEDHSSDNTVYEEELKRKFGVKEENIEVVPTEKKKSNTELNEVEKNTVETTTVEKKNPIAKEKISHEEEQAQINAMTNAITEPVKKYIFPPISLLSRPVNSNSSISRKEIDRNADTLQRTLSSFGVHVKLVNVSCGPAVTRYELQPEQGVKVSSVTKLENDIKLNLAASDIRIEAPIPGKAAIGIEVPNKENSSVILRDLIESDEYKKQKSGLAFAVGKDISGQNIISDIAKMPHLLIAGATGSGKSVCINTLIVSLLYKSSPADVRLIMVDPKVVELSVYNGIPHLLIPVVTDPKKASAALNWAVMEMTNRYGKFAEMQVRDLKSYNEKLEEEPYKSDPNFQKMPQIVIIVDELADLMMVAQNDVEDAICRLAQMARAAGMHLVIATQRPSVNVITGVIKANVPSRIAFSVSSNIDSRTIIDSGGAEKLLGKGDMLFYPSGYPKPIRVQGAFISDKEVSSIVEYIKEKNNEPQYNEEMASHISMMQSSNSAVHSDQSNSSVNGLDEYFTEAGKFIIEKDKASIGMLQRVYRIGFNRAARIMEQLADAGVVSEEEGTKPRHVLMSREQFDQYVEENV